MARETSSTPVVFLAFANDRDAHLELLKRESEDVDRALSELDRREFIKVLREESASSEVLFEKLVLYKDRVTVFHYAGHADGTTLRLEGGDGHAGGIAGLLGEQDQLKLVFLNGCATEAQVSTLMDAGVPAVIATSVSIRDDKACLFAARFYAALSQRHSIEQAFKAAKAAVETQFGDEVDVGIVPRRAMTARTASQAGPLIPWRLYVDEDRRDEVLRWKLPRYKPASIGLPAEMVKDLGRFTNNRYVMMVLAEMAKYVPAIHEEMRKRDSSAFPSLIMKNLPWPLGSQVLLLIQNPNPGLPRLEALISAYVRVSQTLYFIQLSDLWEGVHQDAIDLPSDFETGLPMNESRFMTFDFLTKTIELFELMVNQGIQPFVAELELLAAAWSDPTSQLRKAHSYLEERRTDLHAADTIPDLDAVCVKAEQALAILLMAVAFLARYRMLTVRTIGIEAPRFGEVAYDLDMGALHGAAPHELRIYSEPRWRRKSHYSNSRSVVLVQDEDEFDRALNLSPFIVDKNTFASVKQSETTVPQIFMTAFEQDGRIVYLALDHSLLYALANKRDQIHTDMTLQDFQDGSNLLSPDTAESDFSDVFGPESTGEAEESARVFQIFRDQFDAFAIETGTAR